MSAPPSGRLRRRLGVLLALIVVAGLVASSDPLFAQFNALILDLEPFMLRHRVLGMTMFSVLAAISAFLAFFSSTLLVPIALHAWGATLTIVLLWSGWILGGCTAYWLGRQIGRPAARALAGPERLGWYETRLGARAPFSLVLLLHLALQSEIPGLVLGLLRYDFRRFLLALGLAEIPYAVGVVYLSRFFIDRQAAPLILGGIGALAAAVWAVRVLHDALETDPAAPATGSVPTPASFDQGPSDGNARRPA